IQNHYKSLFARLYGGFLCGIGIRLRCCWYFLLLFLLRGSLVVARLSKIKSSNVKCVMTAGQAFSF
ncbi:MAG: hypothetical protein ACPGYX_01455, partial [Oceanobacter sp.]